MDPTPKFRRGDDPVPPPAPEPDEIEVEAALPEPLTAEARVQRLGVIKAEITEAHSRYKKNAQGALRYAKRMGVRLIAAKTLIGHGRFATWVHDNCPFSHRTANNYMYLAESDLKSAAVANLAEQGTVDAIELHLARKSAAQARRRKQEEKAERRGTLPQSPLQLKRQRKQLSFLENRMFNQQRHQAAQQDRSEQYQAQDQPDLTKLPRPQDAARVEIEWQLPDEVICGIIVWLPDDGHLTAFGAKKKTSWRGGMALRYRWIHYTKGNNAKDYSVAIDEGHFDHNYKTWADGDTWEEVQAKLSALSQGATRIRRAEPMDRDPATARILDTLRAVIRHYRWCPLPHRPCGF